MNEKAIVVAFFSDASISKAVGEGYISEAVGPAVQESMDVAPFMAV